MKRLFLLTVVIALCFSDIAGQQDVSINRRDFRTDKPGFDDAWRSVRAGERHFSRGVNEYSEAFREYLKAYDHNSNYAPLNYKIGVTALFTFNGEKALPFFLSALESDPGVADDILLLTGRAYQYSGMFIEALSMYTKYMDAMHGDRRADLESVKRFIDECNAAISITSDTARIEIVNMGETINSAADDYSPVPGVDDLRLYFASRRPVDNRSRSRYDDNMPDEKIFISTRGSGRWSLAMPVEGKINSNYSESPLFMSDDGTRLYIYAGYRGAGDILVSELRGGVWRSPRPFDAMVNSPFPETSFAISPTGDEIAFVSSRRGGEGGKDIYFIRKIGENRWGTPFNAGSVINTPFDEEGVAYSAGGDTLWFSSQGHNSMGGFDIFYTIRLDDGSWSQPVNAGVPINSPYDDIHFTRSAADDSLFYFASNRPGGFGGFDIYKARLLPPEPEPEPEVEEEEPEPEIVRSDTVRVVDTVVVREIIREVAKEEEEEAVFIVEGRVLDSADRTPLLARIDLIDPVSSQIVASAITSEETGFFRMNVGARRRFMAEIRSNGYISDMRSLEIPETVAGDSYSIVILMNKMEVGQRVVLQNIFFETASAILTAESFSELEKLLRIMQNNPGMRIEISGHTDSTGSESLNLSLSRERAGSVAAYLTGKGIRADRVEIRGYGSSQPIDTNETAEGRARNRRVEFKIIEF